MDTGSLGGAGDFEDAHTSPRWPTESDVAHSGEVPNGAGGAGAYQSSGVADQPTGSGALRHWRERLGRPPRPHPAAVPGERVQPGDGGESPRRIDTGGAQFDKQVDKQSPGTFSVEEFTQRLRDGPMSALYSGEPKQSANSGERLSATRDNDPGSGTGELAAGELVEATVPAQARRAPERRPPSATREAEAAPEEPSGLVRPYFRTKGRTKPAHDLAIETLVSTSEQGRMLDQVRVPEHRSICDLCLDTRSVAEVAAHLRLPLGVVRVLIADVTGLGLVRVHSGSSLVGDRPSLEFMERVLSGLRRI